MIDFHSHVLPRIDDGARDETESAALLQMLSDQGIDRLAVTPHFYAESRTPEQFLEKRAVSYERLRSVLTPGSPEIRLGAEVFYYPGISRMEQLARLCLEGTNLLLLEMPTVEWRRAMVSEIIEIERTRGLSVVLAHIERYAEFKKRDVIERLLDEGVSLQINAEALLNRRTRGRAMKMLLRDEIRFIGSDCHDPKNRPPQMMEAYEYLKVKTKGKFLESFEEQNLSDWEAKH